MPGYHVHEHVKTAFNTLLDQDWELEKKEEKPTTPKKRTPVTVTTGAEKAKEDTAENVQKLSLKFEKEIIDSALKERFGEKTKPKTKKVPEPVPVPEQESNPEQEPVQKKPKTLVERFPDTKDFINYVTRKRIY
jgi:hypothetical protein